jgi:hypothetical protein
VAVSANRIGYPGGPIDAGYRTLSLNVDVSPRIRTEGVPIFIRNRGCSGRRVSPLDYTSTTFDAILRPVAARTLEHSDESSADIGFFSMVVFDRY